MTITREKFIEATGREPQHDDLDRVNCDRAGEITHLCCGWDHAANKPRYETFGGVITVTNPGYRDWLLQKAEEATTTEERERLLRLANGTPPK